MTRKEILERINEDLEICKKGLREATIDEDTTDIELIDLLACEEEIKVLEWVKEMLEK